MLLTTAPGIEQEPPPVVLEKILSPVTPGEEHEPSPAASEQIPVPMCDSIKLSPVTSNLLPSLSRDSFEPSSVGARAVAVTRGA
jgi:hypothetical protein